MEKDNSMTPVILKWEGGKNGNAILVLPTYDTNPGNIMVYAHIGQHSEACQIYYYGLRNPRGIKQLAECGELLREYKANNDGGYKIVKRDLQRFKKARWRW